MDRITSADGTVLAVERSGTGPGLVMIDPAGGFSGLRPMGEAVELLARRFSVLTFDRRGRGGSGDTQPFAVQREVEDVAAVTRRAPAPVTLYGFSSGAALALHAAAAGIAVERVVLLEPAVDLDGPVDTAFTAELGTLIAADRRAEAIEYFNRSIGVPEEWVLALREHPAWEGLQALAHTLLYDAAISATVTRELLAGITVPVVVLASDGSDEAVQHWSWAVSEALPSGTFRRLSGEWHGVPAETLADAVLAATLPTGSDLERDS